MVVEIDVEPLAAAGARTGSSTRDQLSPHPLAAAARRHDRVEDEGMSATVPRHVDEADQVASAPCADPAEAVFDHLASPLVIAKRVLERLSVQRVEPPRSRTSHANRTSAPFGAIYDVCTG